MTSNSTSLLPSSGAGTASICEFIPLDFWNPVFKNSEDNQVKKRTNQEKKDTNLIGCPSDQVKDWALATRSGRGGERGKEKGGKGRNKGGKRNEKGKREVTTQ